MGTIDRWFSYIEDRFGMLALFLAITVPVILLLLGIILLIVALTVGLESGRCWSQ